MRSPVTLSMQDQKTLEVLTLLDRRNCTVTQAAELLGKSRRQVYRKLKAYRQRAAAAIPHGNRGRTPSNALDPQLRQQIVALAVEGPYSQCNNHHVADLLAQRHGLHVSVATVRRLRHAAGVRSPRTRRPPKAHRPRTRKPQAGMMQQLDASPHHWFGPDLPPCALHAAVDDATGQVTAALFRHAEDCAGYMGLMQQVARRYGLPLSVYSDRHDIFLAPSRTKLSIAQQLAGQQIPLSQFARALAELGITQITAHTPQAKGRVERLFGTFQDRLLQELRIAGTTTIEDANRFLPGFLRRYNARFAKPPTDPQSAWRPAPPRPLLQHVLCLKFTRTVAKDNAVTFGSRRLLVSSSHTSYAHKRVQIHVTLDGRISFWHQGQSIGTGPRVVGELRTDPSLLARMLPPQEPVAAPPQPATPNRKPPREAVAVTPSPDHPWQRSFRYGKSRARKL